MSHSQSLLDKVEAIKHSCSPLGVTVKLIRRKDRYYIKLSCDIKQSAEWLQQWGGFYAFSKYQIRPHFYDAAVTSSGAGYSTYFVGTFFDFLTQ